MTRARELARLGNTNVLSVDSDNNLGIGSLTPDRRLDVGTGDLVVGAAITLGGSSGIISATSFKGSITGPSGTFSGNVTIGGTLTYDDVTNIDSVGLITAQSGVKVTGGEGVKIDSGGLNVTSGLGTFKNDVEFHGAQGVSSVTWDKSANSLEFVDNALLRIGTGNDLEIYHADSISYIKASTTLPLYIQAPSGESMARFTPNSGVQLYDNGSAKIQTASSGVVVTGVLTATSFEGNGANLTGVVSGIEVKSSGSSVGTSLTAINFSGATASTGSAGITTITIAAAGLSTDAYSVPTAGLTTYLKLDDAQDHKLTASGITTVTCYGGTESESHTLRIVNSGITTVGFSTYFLWPSGGSPVLPTASGAISLISFTVQRVGAAGTQLLAGASLNFS